MKLTTARPARTKLHFDRLPSDYEALCRLHLPRPIHDAVEYGNLLEIAEAFAGFEDRMSKDQNDYFDLITKLIEEWEASQVTWKALPALKILAHLLDEHELGGADLSRILEVSRNLGPAILRGEREITAGHARTLGAHFGLPAGTFIE
jgi:antitoxin component HigA of HigAB toxin-antitoxin module